MFRGETRDARGNVIAGNVGVNDLDLVVPNKLGDLHSAQNTERMPYRNVKDALVRQNSEPVLPVAGRTKSNKYIVAAFVEAAAKIDDMPLGTAEVPCR